ncbi:MAG: M20/M25/M40 family metallo-hydrolase [Acidobacteria bacterium]|nr:M20/M25/M40 family metallo-hydrolase [Acidobacteriota bacterium]
MISRILAVAALWAAASLPALAEEHPPQAVEKALTRISAASLKGHVSFLASDLLEGRDTPSRGLEVAAEYIAAQFLRAGLDPVPGTGGYFQNSDWIERSMPAGEIRFSFESGDQKLDFDSARLSIRPGKAAKHERLPVFKARIEDADKLKAMPEGKLEGWAVVVLSRRGMQSMSVLSRLKPALVVAVRGDSETGRGASRQLVDPKNPQQGRMFGGAPVTVHSPALSKLIESLPEGETGARLSLMLPEPVEKPVRLRNVIGVLPGSDPELKDTYVLVTAHYDHVGIGPEQNGDRIYNGANDDASGTASVMELASVMAAMKTRPRRTLVFMAVFGEEKGLLGSQYYARNPVFPLEKTIAGINLEHMGRTDSNDGQQLNRLYPTGYDYSEIISVFENAGRQTGVEIRRDGSNGEAFFARSDNLAFARAGIPAHTFCVAFLFPEYHQAGDHWDKIDYENMARVNRTVALSLWLLGERREPPRWNESSAKTESYRNASKRLGNKTSP